MTTKHDLAVRITAEEAARAGFPPLDGAVHARVASYVEEHLQEGHRERDSRAILRRNIGVIVNGVTVLLSDERANELAVSQ